MYNIGDRVRVVNYGHPFWIPHSFIEKGWGSDAHKIGETETHVIVDTNPDVLGKEGLVQVVTTTQGRTTYSIAGIGAWYNEDQLELVEKNNAAI